MAVVFYAGHGIEVDGRNFLVPVDASPRIGAYYRNERKTRLEDMGYATVTTLVGWMPQ